MVEKFAPEHMPCFLEFVPSSEIVRLAGPETGLLTWFDLMITAVARSAKRRNDGIMGPGERRGSCLWLTIDLHIQCSGSSDQGHSQVYVHGGLFEDGIPQTPSGAGSSEIYVDAEARTLLNSTISVIVLAEH
jgi:hypothetical protein